MTQSRGYRRSAMWHTVSRVTEDDARAQRALADVIRERAGLIGRSQASIYRAIGIPSSSWQNYFKTCDREVPHSVVRAVAHELGLTAGQLVARAELREAELSASSTPEATADRLLATLPAGVQAEIARAAEGLRPKRPEAATDPKATGDGAC